MRGLRQSLVMLVALGLVVGLAAPASAQQLRYLGRDGTGAGWVRWEDQAPVAVREGDEIAGWGWVMAVESHELWVTRPFTDDEQAAVRAQGGLAVPAVVIIVPHVELVTLPVPLR